MGKPVVTVAMSGGVDSSVAALLLLRRGYAVRGAHLRLFGETPRGAEADAAAVCNQLGIPFQAVDLREPFQEAVVEYFCREYLRARTPNPCVRCNARIKFGLLMDRALQSGSDLFATGHYARVEEDPGFDGPVLKKGVDPRKDQSYALFLIAKERLARLLLPLGGQTKVETRRIAAEAGFPVKDKEESQDICFLPQGDYAGFLRERYPACAVPGPIKNRLGQVLGTHEGLVLYTIGQRRGIGIAAPRPYFVIELRPEENTLIVGFEAETYVTEFRVLDLNWHHRPAGNSFETQVKIRYSSRACPAWVFLQDRGEALVRYQEPQRSVTPGQAAVFYRGDAVLGGGWIGARPPASE